MLRSTTTLILAAFLAGGAGAAGPSAAPHPAVEEIRSPDAETRRLTGWLDSLFMAEVARSPQAQTQLGMMLDAEAYGRWDDRSEAAAHAE